MPALLDVLVGTLVGEGLCPPGEGLCLPVRSCLPAGWGLCLLVGSCLPGMMTGYASTLFPFTVRVVSRCAACAIDITGSCLCPDLSPFLSPFATGLYLSLLSLGVYQGVFLALDLFPLFSFCQECTNVFLCYLGMPVHTVPRYLPFWEKKALYHCNVLKIGQILSKYHLKIVHKCTKLFRKSLK